MRSTAPGPGDRLAALRSRVAVAVPVRDWWLVVLAVVLHLPGYFVRLVNSDEASLATMATVINHGGRLYHETADRKPPIVPYVYALVFRVTGSTDLRPVRLVAALLLGLTAVLLASEARRRYGNRASAVVCGVLFLLAVSAVFPADSQAATFELFMLLPMTAAFVVAGRRRPLAAGVLLALACLCKQTAITAMLPIAYLTYWPLGIAGLRRLATGLVAPILVAAAFFGPGPFLLWTVTGNGGYLGQIGSVGSALLRGAGVTTALVALEIGLVVLAVLAARRRAIPIDLWMWLLSGAVAVVAGFRFFGHYYLQLVPPAALLAVAGFEAINRRGRVLALGALAAPAMVCTVIGFFPIGDSAEIPYARLADKVRAVSAGNDTVFVWGDLPELYWASGRRPATRFVHTGFLTGNTGGRPNGSGSAEGALPGAWEMLAEDVQRRPPDVIVDTSTGRIRQQEFYPLSSTPLAAVVRSSYRLVGEVEGVRIYHLNPGH
jgi:hypothetical protein